MKSNLPITILFATRNRRKRLHQTLLSLLDQTITPRQILICDSSSNFKEIELKNGFIPSSIDLQHWQASCRGAAPQRTEAFERANQPYVLIVDDDIDFYPYCLERLFETIKSNNKIGGCIPTITNCQYTKPSFIFKAALEWLSEEKLESYAGKCIGPAINIISDSCHDLPEVQTVEWLHSTCVLYRKCALPNPLFPDVFKGASVAEDLALSLRVRQNWELVHVRKAEIFHDSQPGDHKASHRDYKKSEILNRQYIMEKILNNDTHKNRRKLLIYEALKNINMLRNNNCRKLFWENWKGIQDARQALKKIPLS